MLDDPHLGPSGPSSGLRPGTSLAVPSLPEFDDELICARTATILRFVLLAAFVSAAVSRISRPGLLYDEILFVNAALGGVDENFVHARLWGVRSC